MNGAKEKLMREIQILGFAIVETNLFLNTHPDCEKAVAFLNDLIEKKNEKTAEYEAKYGHVTAAGGRYRQSFDWAKSLWPWEYGFGTDEAEVNG
ncbi:MAG: spore coat protein CotJB [Clostridia bacterium]|jgi:spore coat protein JB|nr:spore coat protein CotJB [Clostridia bacterium]MBQ1436263.1 spore coat protein CotJB [Clostridia bacterium]